MKTIHIIDTSVYLVILRVPNHFTERQLSETQDAMEEYITNKSDHLLFLPFGTIIETGNHIADSRNGRRYHLVRRFVQDVKNSINEGVPYTIAGYPTGSKSLEQIIKWIDEYATLAKSGIGMVDVNCINIFNEMHQAFPHHRVRIWTYDEKHLGVYDYTPVNK